MVALSDRLVSSQFTESICTNITSLHQLHSHPTFLHFFELAMIEVGSHATKMVKY